MTRYKIDVLIPGSANDQFFSQLAVLRRSLDALGGDFAQARLVGALGEWDTPQVPPRWTHHLDRVDIVWSNPEKRPNPIFDAQHRDRFHNIRDDADVAILCDADVVFMRPFDDLVAHFAAHEELGGVIAHYHFPIDGRRGDPDTDWNHIAMAAIGTVIERPYHYLFGRAPEDDAITDPQQRPRAPFYINYGFLIGQPHLLRRMHEKEAALIPRVSTLVEPYFSHQVSVALACAALGITTRALPARYNFPNRPEADARQPGELDQVVMLHYLYDETFRRRTLFAARDAFEAFLSKPLTGVDRVFQDYLRQLFGGRYPF